MSELKKGALLHNRSYRVESSIGRGGFGITYIVTHIRLNKAFAMKEFFPKSLCDRFTETSSIKSSTEDNAKLVDKLRVKFLKEARHIAELEHPNIVRIIDVFEENDTAYYLMDYIQGNSLDKIVMRDGPLSEQKAIGYIKKIGGALSYVHSKRMNHLDVKPSNIMVRAEDDTPFLIDFGLSKQYDVSGNQTSNTPVGVSRGFAPVEQYKDGGVNEFSPQTDVYSLAATLYFLLTGEIPPQAPDLIDEQLTFPANFPERLKPVILRGMATKRTDRYPTVAEFCDHLDADFSDYDTQMFFQTKSKRGDTQFHGGNGSTPPPPTPDNPPQNKGKNNSKTIIWVLSCILTLLVLAIIGSIIFRSNNSSQVSGYLTDTVATEYSEDDSDFDFDNSTITDVAEPAEEAAPAVEEVEKSASEPQGPYSAEYYLAGTFTDQYGVERPICLELESTSIDSSPRGKIHNLNANAAVFINRSETSSSWIYRGSDGYRQYTLTIPRGSNYGRGATITIDGYSAIVGFDGVDYYSPHSAATASTKTAKQINSSNGVSKVNDGYYRY